MVRFFPFLLVVSAIGLRWFDFLAVEDGSVAVASSFLFRYFVCFGLFPPLFGRTRVGSSCCGLMPIIVVIGVSACTVLFLRGLLRRRREFFQFGLMFMSFRFSEELARSGGLLVSILALVVGPSVEGVYCGVRFVLKAITCWGRR